MTAGGDDDTIAGTHPSITGTTQAIPELVANRYRIVRWLGGGGMGRVYEAEDTELGERVALKVLRAGLSEEALERFRREVRLTRRIRHANVARMFDIGESEGERFLTMELVDGTPLTRELGMPMPWHRLRPLVIQIAEGLAAAHELGIVHRDLKPDNILIERGTERAVITDFGIARSVDDSGVTQDGAVVGTPRYMAPEQLSGRGVDTRADIFSLGVMMYELASAERPWTGENVIAIAVAQATQPAAPLRFTTLPPGFIALVQRCIELDPARRPATVADVLAILRAPETAPPDAPAVPVMRERELLVPNASPTIDTSHESTLAVMPLACAPGDEYLADGVHEDLIDTLSTTPHLRVRPAGMVRSQAEPDPRVVGRSLDVDHVVVGSLRRTPAGIRVSARLIGVADGFQIWAHRAQCAETDVLALSETLAREIASALSTRATAATRPTDPRSVDLYLRARAELRRFWGSHAQSAADLLDEAYALSPASGPIAGARALASVTAWVLQGEPALLGRARRALEQGLASDHPEAYLAAASFKLNTGDPVGAAGDLGTALVRAPMLAQAHEMAAKLLVELGAVAEARRHFETATALDPTRVSAVSMELARLDALEGWWERADATIARLLADPDPSLNQLGFVFQARLAGWRGDRAAMLAGARRVAPRMGPSASKLIDYLSTAALPGTIDESAWRNFLREFGGAEKPQRGELMGLQLLSEIAMLFGNDAVGIDTLEEADRRNFLDLVVLDRCPLYDRLRGEARFQRLRVSVGDRAARVLASFRATAG